PKGARKPAASKARSQPPEAPQPPLPQELPPVAPSVSYRGGLLTIIAQNSTLFDILSAVRKATGAAVDTPASATERVATRLGPGQPRDVLAALLNGSRFDYILLSLPEDPGGVRRLILTPRSAGGAPASAAYEVPSGAAISPAAVRSAPGARTLPPDTSEDESPSPEESVEPAEEVQPEPPAAPPQQPEVKSPEQLQEELRRHEEEQRIQQQHQQQQQEEQPPQDQRKK
ncbi:MAG: hypothetical protein ACRD2K_06880, partial [Terriglobales bacterium]